VGYFSAIASSSNGGGSFSSIETAISPISSSRVLPPPAEARG